MGTHLRELSESVSMNTNMTGFRCFSKNVVSLCFGERVTPGKEGLSPIVLASRASGHRLDALTLKTHLSEHTNICKEFQNNVNSQVHN